MQRSKTISESEAAIRIPTAEDVFIIRRTRLNHDAVALLFTTVNASDKYLAAPQQRYAKQGRIQRWGFVGFGRTPPPSETKKLFEAILVGRGLNMVTFCFWR